MPRFSTDGDLIPDGYDFNCDGDLVKVSTPYQDIASKYFEEQSWDMPTIRHFGQMHRAAKTDPIMRDMLEKCIVYYKLKYGS